MRKILVLLVFLVSCMPNELQSGSIPYSTYLPILYKEYKQKPIFFIENEGVDWSILSPYYPNEYLIFSVNAEWLDEKGWSYFDRKYVGYTGPIFLKLRGAYNWMVDPSCGAIPKEYWDSWITEFVVPVIEHIGKNQIVKVELLNEVDTDYSGAKNYFGCWGTVEEQGKYYAEFVNYVYPILKSFYPNIEFIAGAFMNPTNDFVLGVSKELKYVDAVSYHFYPYTDTNYDFEFLLRYETMKQRFDFPLLLSETMLICNEPTTLCYLDQKDYIHKLTTTEIEVTTIGVYTAGCNNWKCADLIYPCNPITLKPAYYEFMGRE